LICRNGQQTDQPKEIDMKRYLLILACALLIFTPTRILAQVNCPTIAQEEILHCDNPSDPTVRNIAGLSLQRGNNYHCYREPRIVITRTSGAQEVYSVADSKWQLTAGNKNVQTTFTDNVTATFTMSSTPGFSPSRDRSLSGGGRSPSAPVGISGPRRITGPGAARTRWRRSVAR
jgi:hypothetical protein